MVHRENTVSNRIIPRFLFFSVSRFIARRQNAHVTRSISINYIRSTDSLDEGTEIYIYTSVESGGRGDDVEHEDICYVIVTPLSYFQCNFQGISEP